jgi:hypothetical protein
MIFCAGVSLAGTAPLAAQAPASAEAPHHAVHRAADIDWKPGPPSLPPGAQFVLLEGDPSKAGFFALQLKMPDGYVIPPHWHPVQERVTVLSGTFHLGQGNTVDRQAAQALPAGSYFSLAPKMTHYGVMKGETVVQLTSIGPWQITYVNAADDPRK